MEPLTCHVFLQSLGFARPPTVAAFARIAEAPDLESLMSRVGQWLAAVAGQGLSEDALMKGRLAFLRCHGAERWPEIFLSPPPWPKAFQQALMASWPQPLPPAAPVDMPAQPLARASWRLPVRFSWHAVLYLVLALLVL